MAESNNPPLATTRLDQVHGPIDVRAVYEELLRQSTEAEFDLDGALSTIRSNPAVEQRLLQFTNALPIGLSHRVDRPRHALAILGAAGVRRMSEATLRQLNSRVPRA